MSRIVDGYFFLLKILIAACLAAMVVLVFGNVVLRYGFNSGITVSEELSRLFFVWLTFLGSLVALRNYGHLGMDTLVAMLPRSGKLLCFIISHALMLYVTWLLLQGSWVQTMINWDMATPATGLSQGWFYGAGIVFGVCAMIIIGVNFIRALLGRLNESELIMISESEEIHGGHAPQTQAPTSTAR